MDNRRAIIERQIRAAEAADAVGEVNALSAELHAAEEDFADRVAELEAEGLSTSDAQSAAEAEGW